MSPSPAAPSRLGDQLVQEGLITNEQLVQALHAQRDYRESDPNGSAPRVGYFLSSLGFIDELELVKHLAIKFRVHAADIRLFEPSQKWIESARRLVPAEFALKNRVLPLKKDEKDSRVLYLGMADPGDTGTVTDVEFLTRFKVVPIIVGDHALETALKRIYSDPVDTDKTAAAEPVQQFKLGAAPLRATSKKVTETESKESKDEFKPVQINLKETLDRVQAEVDDEIELIDDEKEDGAYGTAGAEDSAIVKLVDGLLKQAVTFGASDIHIEPYEDRYRVRYRKDGELQEVMDIPIKKKAAMTSRIKIMSKLNIAEKRVPQDGRIKLKMGKKVVDFRVSVLPVIHGEKIVLRILDKGNLTLDLTKFGFEPKAQDDLMNAIAQPVGMVLVTGPTGSGKTTTLYSALNQVNTTKVNIMTAEDPVEYQLPGVNQVQIRVEVKLDFPAALKAFLRQDPNIILIGEIRDLDTGSIAIKAALTGHLVLATLHTNDAPATITRLLDMGLEPFNVSAALTCVVAQRLLRKICPDCKLIMDTTKESKYSTVFDQMGLGPADRDPKQKFYIGCGTKVAGGDDVDQRTSIPDTVCETCSGSGHKGRQGIYEVLFMTPRLRDIILSPKLNTDMVRNLARHEGMLTLREDGLVKARRGTLDLLQVRAETVNDPPMKPLAAE
jgi:type IV pilus assembly protein PilB